MYQATQLILDWLREEPEAHKEILFLTITSAMQKSLLADTIKDYVSDLNPWRDNNSRDYVYNELLDITLNYINFEVIADAFIAEIMSNQETAAYAIACVLTNCNEEPIQ